MRTAITLVRKHGEKQKSVIAGPEVSIVEQITRFKKAVAVSHKEHPDFAEIEIWTSDSGRTKYVKFAPPSAPEAGSKTSEVSANPVSDVALESTQPLNDSTPQPSAKASRRTR
jgi:N-acetylmuramic acid 6-phosphate (MurNAc-6-P) etherase